LFPSLASPLLDQFDLDVRINNSPVVSADNIVYFGSAAGVFYALKLKNDGKFEKLDEFSTQAPISSSPLVTKDGVVFIGSHDLFFTLSN